MSSSSGVEKRPEVRAQSITESDTLTVAEKLDTKEPPPMVVCS